MLQCPSHGLLASGWTKICLRHVPSPSSDLAPCSERLVFCIFMRTGLSDIFRRNSGSLLIALPM